MYLSIFNSFRVIQCLFYTQVQKSLFLPHFCFPWGRPWGNHAKCCMIGKRIQCLQLPCWMCPSNYNRFSDRARLFKNCHFFIPPLHSTPQLGGFPSEYHYPVWCEKTRIVWLPDGEKISKISSFVLAQLTNVTDRQTDRQTPHAGNSRAYA